MAFFSGRLFSVLSLRDNTPSNRYIVKYLFGLLLPLKWLGSQDNRFVVSSDCVCDSFD